jgi:predicted ester cyclase
VGTRGATRINSQAEIEANKDLVRRVYGDIRSEGRLDVVDEVFHDDYVGFDPTAAVFEVRGKQGFKDQTSHYRSVFPDLSFTIESLIGEGDEVVTRWTARGTHAGSLAGELPTGASVTTSGFGSWRVEDCRIIKHYGVFDIMGMLQQIGALPPK